jgi:zinc protease
MEFIVHIKSLVAVLFLLFPAYSMATIEQPSIAQDRKALLAPASPKCVDVDASIKSIRANIYKETFENGLTLLFYHQAHTPEVMLKVVYDVGSKDEESAEYGFAHLVEHMIFKGTQKLSEQDIFEIARKFGAELNAYTSYDRTVYYFDTDKKNWRVFVNILADCMQNVRIADEHLASELKAIFDELKMRDGDGSGNAFTELFTSNHPYHHPVVGYKENLLHLNPEKVRAFYKKYYRPDRATIIVVGDLEKDDVVREIRTACGAIPCPQEPLIAEKPSQSAYMNKDFFQKNVVVYKSIPNTNVECVWTIPGSTETKQSICAGAIAQHLTTRLNEVLHDNQGIVSSIFAYPLLLEHAGIFSVEFKPQDQTVNTNGAIKACKKIIIQEIGKIIAEGLPHEELGRVKRVLKVSLLRAFESCSAIAHLLESSYSISKNEYAIFDSLAVLDALTNDDIKAFGRCYVRPALMNVFITKPLGDDEKEAWLTLQHTVDIYDSSLLALKTRSVELEKPTATHVLPTPEMLDVTFEKPDTEFDLDNGLHVMLKQRKEVPFIVARFSFKNWHNFGRYCSEHDMSSLLGLSYHLLNEGSTGYNKEDHRKFFEDLGASCHSQGFSCLASDFDAVAHRHLLIVSTPTYPQQAFDIAIANEVQNYEQQQENEYFVASDTLTKHLCRDDFLCQKTVADDIAELKKCTRSALIEFHDAYMIPSNMLLAVVGDFDASTIRQQIENAYGQWKNSATACSIQKTTSQFPQLANPETRDCKIYMPKERVIVTAGRITVKRDEDDYARLLFLELYINKKLFELREHYGLFYGCSCDLTSDASYEQQGHACVTSELSLAHVDAVTQLIKNALRAIAEQGISQEDFNNARNTMINDRAKSYDTNSSIAASFIRTKSHGDSWDRAQQRFEKILHVTREEVSAAARTYLNPDDWSFVTVGRIGEKGIIHDKK